MKLFKKLFFIFLILTSTIILKNTNIAYAASTYYDSIEGTAYEYIEGVDESEYPKISGVKVSLYNENGDYIKSTYTNSNGNYKFSTDSNGNPLPAGKYTVKFTWGGTDEIINGVYDISDISDSKIQTIKSILKYNAQDYMPADMDDSISVSDDIYIYLVIDKSGSMSGSSITQAKNLAINIVDALLEEHSLGDNITAHIGLISFSGVITVHGTIDELNREQLNAQINSISASGSTYTKEALEKAFEDLNTISSENRFIFLLTDGAANGNGGMSGVQSYIRDTILANNIGIYTLYIGYNASDIEPYYTFDNELAVFTNVTNLSAENVSSVLSEFLSFIESTIGASSVEEDAEKRAAINEYFSSISNYNTVIFEAINMNIKNSQDLQTFKNYAVEMIDKTSITGTSSRVCRITEKNDESAEAIAFSGPNLILKLRPTFTLDTNMTITGMQIITQTGSVLARHETTASSVLSLVEYRDSSLLYGATVELEYTLGISNISDYMESSTYSNDCNKLVLFCYIPDGFTYNANSSFITNGVTNIDENYIQITQVTSDNINELLYNYYYTSQSTYNTSNSLNNTTLYKDIVNNGKAALLITLNLENGELDVGNEDNPIQIKFMTSKLIASSDVTTYNDSLEIIQYSNENFRRMFVSSRNPSTGATTLTGVTAGNCDEDEADYVTTSNAATIIPPTGKNQSLTYVYIIIGILLTLLTLIIVAKINAGNSKNKNK